MMQIPDYAKLPGQPQSVIYEGAPRQYRFDGEIGEFLVGEDSHGPELQIQIFRTRWGYGHRWGRPGQSWLDLAFIDKWQIVSVLSLKKESAINLHEFQLDLKQLNHCGVDPAAVWVVLEAIQRQGEDSPYYVVKPSTWGFVDHTRFEAAKRFDSSGRFDWILSGECF